MNYTFGYARISSKSQNADRQVKKFRDMGIEERHIFIDVISGSTFDRPKYNALLVVVRKGDLIKFDELDRLGRNYDEILKNWNYITRDLGVDIVILEKEELFDSRKFRSMGDLGRFLEDQFLSLLAYLAEQELKKSKRRQREGIDLALKKGVKFGREKKYAITPAFIEMYNSWKAGNITATAAWKSLDLKKTTFYRLVKEYEDQNS